MVHGAIRPFACPVASDNPQLTKMLLKQAEKKDSSPAQLGLARQFLSPGTHPTRRPCFGLLVLRGLLPTATRSITSLLGEKRATRSRGLFQNRSSRTLERSLELAGFSLIFALSSVGRKRDHDTNIIIDFVKFDKLGLGRFPGPARYQLLDLQQGNIGS